MLGKLFKGQNGATGSPTNSVPSTNSGTCNTSHNSYEDPYTREILYGTLNQNLIKPCHLNLRQFRILVCQDGGNLRTKQILFDSACENNMIPIWGTRTGVAKTQPKVFHSVSELNDYTFGCGLPSNESICTTKAHILPALNNDLVNGAQHSILISRLFLIIDEDNYVNNSDEGWKPKSALSIKAKNYLFSKDRVSSRFSIGLVVPLESLNDLHDVIFNNWEEISHFLIVLQNIIIKKLVAHLTENASFIVNKRIQLTSGILQNDHELGNQVFRLVKLIHYNSNLPKLINSNYLIRSSTRSSKYSAMMLNWVLEILNWLEFKDGKPTFNHPHLSQNTSLSVEHNSTFLSNIIALIIPLRRQLMLKPVSDSSDSKKKEVVRIVLMTGNPVVAKKLIFILNGFIPERESVASLDIPDYRSERNIASDAYDDIDQLNRSYGLDASKGDLHSIYSGDSVLEARPIPIRSPNLSRSVESSDNSPTKSFLIVKGWEIPNKSVTSTSGITNSNIETTSQNIPIKQKTTPGSSLSKSSSMAYLSSSLNSSLSSSQSSLSKWGGSFLDKWKNPTTPTTQSSMNVFEHNIDHFNSPIFGSLSKRSSVQSLRSPSPAIEYEDYGWPQTSLNSNSFQHKLSRTQSMYDLYNKNLFEENKPIDLNRTRTSIFTPLTESNVVKNIDTHNRDAIYKKCSFIMKSRIRLTSSREGVLEVEPIIFEKQEDLDNDGITITSSFSGGAPQELPVFKRKPLAPSVAFSDEFRPEFLLQSCPINPKLENQVMNAMKNDLLFNLSSKKYDKISSKTIFISLRAREVKVIEMATEGDHKEQHPSHEVSSLPSSYNLADSTPTEINFQRRPSAGQGGAGNSYKTTIRKVFSPHRSLGDKKLVNIIENTFHEINSLLINNKADSKTASDFNRLLSKCVADLLG
ncbi:uncharacterized protein PRCAT00004516001 [Priceomyces carsonii]|uniref:uncharacterized protein n=1 Tax=Priceomyces carsonii TaxID=28549 RepID=UPI002EDAFE29|nr:unnamed protein product [Priceomyces carsonii]